MRIALAKFTTIFSAGAIIVMLMAPGAIVYAQGNDRAGHDIGADGAQHGSDTGASGPNKERSTTGKDMNSDVVGDSRSNQTGAGPHTGASGLGAGGDDKTTAGHVTTSSTTTGHVTSHVTSSVTTSGEVSTSSTTTGHVTSGVTTSGGPTVAETPSGSVSGAGGVTAAAPAGSEAGAQAPGAAGVVTTTPAGLEAGTATPAPGAGAAPGATAISPPSVPPLGAAQTAAAPPAPAVQHVAVSAQQTKPRTLPYTGLSAAWAMLISGGRWAGMLLSALGLLLLVRGLRRA